MPTLIKEWWKCDRCGKAFADDRGAAESCEAGHARAETSADFGRRMREARRARKLTILDVGKAILSPVDKETLGWLCRIEGGEEAAPPAVREAIARFVGIDP
jgi:hypothetical protein